MTGIVTWDKSGNPIYQIDGATVTEEEFHATFHPVSEEGEAGSSLVCWARPMASEALAVHPSQIAEAAEYDSANGVPTDYLPDGRPQWRDRDHRRRHCELHRVFDKDGGYSDAQRGATRGRHVPPEQAPNFRHLDSASGQPGVEKRSTVRYFHG